MIILRYKELEQLEFPVYRLPSDEIEIADGLVFIEGRLLDDRNMPGKTLGIRRLQTPYKKLFRLNKQVETVIGMMKQTSKYFIDSKGRIFMYEKTVFCDLIYYKIKKVQQKEVCSLLWLKGITSPFTILRPPEPGMLWAGILHFGGLPWKLYEYSETPLPKTVRKI